MAAGLRIISPRDDFRLVTESSLRANEDAMAKNTKNISFGFIVFRLNAFSFLDVSRLVSRETSLDLLV